MSTEAKRQFQISTVRIAWFRGFPEWRLADIAARVTWMLVGRCLTMSRSWAETLSEASLRDIGLDRNEIISALARLDQLRMRARSDRPIRKPERRSPAIAAG